MGQLEPTPPRYLVHDKLGSGGMAVVHLGTLVTPAGERRVALKRLLERGEVDAAAEERIIAEAKLVFRLTHTNICQVLDLARSADGTFIVMEFVQGLDLGTLLQRVGAGGLPPAAATLIAREVAQALDYAHRRTDSAGRALMLVHGDVTPHNVLLSDEGEVKLTDFGIARAVRAFAPGNELHAGTPGYVAPEASGHTVDHRVDVYGLGVLLYVALGGESPHRAIDLEELARRRPELPSELIAIVRRATARAPEERFVTTGEMALSLNVQQSRWNTFTAASLAAIVRARVVPEHGGDAAAPPELVSVTQATPLTFVSSIVAGGGRRRTEKLGGATGAGRRRWRWAALGAMGAAALAAVSWARAVSRHQPMITAPERAQATTAPPPPASPPAPTEVPIAAPAEVPAAAPRSPSRRTPSRGPVPSAGFLTVNSTPWGQVYLDGQKVADETPAYRLAVPAGTHRVAIDDPTRRRYSTTKTVLVKPHEAKLLGFDW